MPQTPADFAAKFELAALTVFANDDWTVSLRPRGCTLGACVIAARRPHRSLAGLSPAEATSLVEAVGWFEARSRALFAPDKFNYLALMMVDDQLHFHALPRYAATPSFDGIEWPDPGWPGQPDLGVATATGAAALAAVKAAFDAGASA